MGLLHLGEKIVLPAEAEKALHTGVSLIAEEAGGDVSTVGNMLSELQRFRHIFRVQMVRPHIDDENRYFILSKTDLLNGNLPEELALPPMGRRVVQNGVERWAVFDQALGNGWVLVEFLDGEQEPWTMRQADWDDWDAAPD